MFSPAMLEEMFGHINQLQQRWWQQWMQQPDGQFTVPQLPEQDWLQRQHDYYQQHLDLWLGLIGAKPNAAQVQPERSDRRFNAPEWDDPIYSYIKQSYLLAARWMIDAVANVNHDDEQRERALFFTRQYLDAMSPANFALTNPEVMKLANDTRGESLYEGMKQLMSDIQRGGITMTDESQFEVGRNLATSAGEVVFENELFQLIQYAPQSAKVFDVPLLIVPPCVNKYYIMDLQPENSMVGGIVEAGYTAFLMSWKSIDESGAHLAWDDYIDSGVIRAAEVVREISKKPQINVLSFCIGGELVSTAIPVMQARGLDWFKSVTLMTVMLDHTDPGEIRFLIDPNVVATREAQKAAGGVISGRELARTFSSLRANDLIWNYVVNNYLKGKTPPPFDLLYWNNDSANLALPMHTFFLRAMYLENALIEPGKVTLCNTPIDLTTITVPTYIFAAREDHIVPWKSAYGTTRLFSGPMRFVLGASGHIAGTINPIKANKRNYWVNEQLAADPDAWFEGAESRPGSWWNDWFEWLAPQSGKQIAAPKTAGNAEYVPIEPAPGRYVRARVA
ncbi:class I poly(R)-hydroxyalkanoic acid synthase [Chitinibacteraceae bacterium HSL-7]